jgi:hypothetical protein
MATRRYGISRGESIDQVTEAVGAATATDNIELTVDLATSLTREDVLMALKKFEAYITKGNWPPA